MTARAQKPGHGRRGPARPFSRPVDVRRLPDGGQRQEIAAEPAEREALARAMGLPAIAALRGRFELRPRAGGRVIVTGEVAATVTQTCVVTLEPFESEVAQDVDLVFAPAAPDAFDDPRDAYEAMPRTVPGSDDQADPPDPIIDDVIDLGAVAAEFVALALDPYPRKPGVAFDDHVEARDEEPSAFAALERLKAKS